MAGKRRRDRSDPVTRIRGIGPKTALVLEGAGIRTVGDLSGVLGLQVARLNRGECIRGARIGDEAARAALDAIQRGRLGSRADDYLAEA